MKLRYLIICVACCLAASILFASEVGNNPEGKGFKFDFGYERSSREVKLDKKELIYSETYDYGGGYYDVYQTWITKFDGDETLDKLIAKFSWGFSERYSIYLNLGMARLSSEMYNPELVDSTEYFDPAGVPYYFHEDYYQDHAMKSIGDWDIFYGVGFKAVFFESGDFKVGMDLQYNYFDLKNEADIGHDGYTYPLDNENFDEYYRIDKTKTSDYQLALIFSKKGDISPYGGVKVSGYKTDYDGKYHGQFVSDGTFLYDYTFPFKFSTKPQDFYGFFAGVDWKLGNTMMLNAEMRVGDESALTTALCWKF